MAEHSMCQPGRPATAIPAGDGRGRLAGLRGLPQDEVEGRALVGGDLDPGARLHLVEGPLRQAAVIRHRGDVEQHVIRRHVGVAGPDQGLDHRHHLGDVVGGAGLDEAGSRARTFTSSGMSTPRSRTSRWNCARRAVGQVADARHRLLSPRVDLVIDVGDVTHIGDVLGAIEMAQQPEQHVEDDDRPRIADMGIVIDRRAADIHAHMLGVDRRERLLGSGQGIVKSERHGFLGACRPGDRFDLNLGKAAACQRLCARCR
jgi:hypothetical protein